MHSDELERFFRDRLRQLDATPPPQATWTPDRTWARLAAAAPPRPARRWYRWAAAVFLLLLTLTGVSTVYVRQQRQIAALKQALETAQRQATAPASPPQQATVRTMPQEQEKNTAATPVSPAPPAAAPRLAHESTRQRSQSATVPTGTTPIAVPAPGVLPVPVDTASRLAATTPSEQSDVSPLPTTAKPPLPQTPKEYPTQVTVRYENTKEPIATLVLSAPDAKPKKRGLRLHVGRRSSPEPEPSGNASYVARLNR
ncbi:hypothetical protein SAMN05421823_110123 [Catalinimonas alkaloidigena]|uniref:Uncharacterized protein n=1 Tax=Catalinimonas alkaloidigena TaxID=1075417 RepID=A0A1G9QCV7_9BACT|nr:hypothetical protein [Catalinimonas alkaloidigena]SDM08740.1 hypothetical protein SAMN05421823_110123 [Catalinimonas alkaloidigena]